MTDSHTPAEHQFIHKSHQQYFNGNGTPLCSVCLQPEHAHTPQQGEVVNPSWDASETHELSNASHRRVSFEVNGEEPTDSQQGERVEPVSEVEGVLQQLQYGTGMSDNTEPMLTNNRKIATAAIERLIAEAREKAVDLFVKDMRGYDFTPYENGEDTNALVADALENSKKYVLTELNQMKGKTV